MEIVYAWLMQGLWLAWAVYWMTTGSRAKKVARRESFWQGASWILPSVVGAGLFMTPDHWYGPLRGFFLEQSRITFWIGAGLLAVGLCFSIYARHFLGANWSGSVTVKENHELVRSGPYRWMRHPIYTGLLTAILASALAGGQWRDLLAFFVLAVAIWSKLRREERWMTQQFGEAYATYRNEVRALVPFVI